jgi:hypothetical protein
MGLLYKVSLATAADGTGSYDLPLDTFIPNFEKRKKQNVRKIPGKSGGINTADSKLEPTQLPVTMMIDDSSPTTHRTLRQTLWTQFHSFEGKYIVVWDLEAETPVVCDSWFYDEVVVFAETRVRRMGMRATRLRVVLSLNTQPYEGGGDIP